MIAFQHKAAQLAHAVLEGMGLCICCLVRIPLDFLSAVGTHRHLIALISDLVAFIGLLVKGTPVTIRLIFLFRLMLVGAGIFIAALIALSSIEGMRPCDDFAGMHFLVVPHIPRPAVGAYEAIHFYQLAGVSLFSEGHAVLQIVVDLIFHSSQVRVRAGGHIAAFLAPIITGMALTSLLGYGSQHLEGQHFTAILAGHGFFLIYCHGMILGIVGGILAITPLNLGFRVLVQAGLLRKSRRAAGRRQHKRQQQGDNVSLHGSSSRLFFCNFIVLSCDIFVKRFRTQHFVYLQSFFGGARNRSRNAARVCLKNSAS